MNDLSNELEDLLQEPGWNAEELTSEELTRCFVGIFTKPYAIVGIVGTISVREACDMWLECQEVLVEKSKAIAGGRFRDRYLVMLVDTMDEALSADVRSMINDSQACRKLLLVNEGRNLDEVLEDVPFLFSFRKHIVEGNQETAPASTTVGLPADLLEDLSYRSGDVIIDNMRNGKYGATDGVTHED